MITNEARAAADLIIERVKTHSNSPTASDVIEASRDEIAAALQITDSFDEFLDVLEAPAEAPDEELHWLNAGLVAVYYQPLRKEV